MSTTYETGHAKNVANFQRLIEFVTDYGTDYNPSKKSLQLPALITLKTAADSTLLDVITKNTLFNNKSNSRITEFSDLRPIATRLVNALQATDATPETIDGAKAYNRKIQGKRASDSQTPVNPNAPAPSNISASQLSYDQQIQHFTGLKSVLENEPTYSPNEKELQIPALDTKITNMTDINTEVAAAYAKVSNSRIARDKILYDGEDALLETAGEIKKYIKSVFGAASPQYKQVSGLRFRK